MYVLWIKSLCSNDYINIIYRDINYHFFVKLADIFLVLMNISVYLGLGQPLYA